MELTVIQAIGNFKVVPTLALFQNKKNRLYHTSTQQWAQDLLLCLTLELIWPIPCLTAFCSECCITQFAIIASVLPRIFRQSNLSFGAGKSMNNTLSRVQRKGNHLHHFAGIFPWAGYMNFQAASRACCTLWSTRTSLSWRGPPGASE